MSLGDGAGAPGNAAHQKVKGAGELAPILRGAQARGLTVVFTNGCFDLLHRGHTRYLAQARALGDLLVVGLNSDASVRRLKGPTRPLVPQRDRCEVMAALEMVDYVSVFSEDTPYDLIKLVQPDVLVKGGDWPPDQIVGADIVRARGGSVRSLRFARGYSTSGLLARVVERGMEEGQKAHGKGSQSKTATPGRNPRRRRLFHLD